MYDVYFYEAFEEEAEALKRNLGADVRAGFTWRTIQEAGDAEPPAPFISVRTQSLIPLDWAPKLNAVLARTTGYDHMAAYRDAAGAGDLPIGHLPLYCKRAVAEQAALLWLALLRKLPRQTENFKTFLRDGITGRECEGRTLLVVGVGNVGHEVVRIGRGLGMEVLGVDLVRRHKDIDYVDTDEGLARADVVVCAMSLNSGNVGYFGYERLSRAKSGAVFVNVARGEMSPATDLLRLLEEGRLGGLGLDVYSEEPRLAVALRSGEDLDDVAIEAALELAQRPDVILTPHNAFNTVEAVERKAAQSAEQIRRFLAQGVFLWEVPADGQGG